MIAAYVVLLPDMSRLRFTNLGETGATGGDKGIWGRLGEPERPSYSAIDFALATGQRLIAGVHLERKGEPSVEPTPFIVSDLDADARLQELFLLTRGEHDVVPELSELRENAARLGGRLQVFSSAHDYFAALFEQGVMSSATQGDVHVGEMLVGNDRFEGLKTGGRHPGSPSFDNAQSSSSRFDATARQGRSKSLRIRATRASTSATCPVTA